MKHISVNTYKKDKYYPRIVRAVENILAQSDVIFPSEILIEMGNLSKKNYEAWRKGQVPYLERAIEGSLSKANRILRIIGFHAHDLNMVPRQTLYHQWGKGKGEYIGSNLFSCQVGYAILCPVPYSTFTLILLTPNHELRSLQLQEKEKG